MIVTPDTWIISDTHFGHGNIVKYCGRPHDHNELMESNWLQRIAVDDQILHLGDLSVWFGDEEEYWLNTVSRLPGKKFMLRGNHDKRTDKVYFNHNFLVIPEFIQEIKGQRVLFSHYPDEDRTSQWDINIHGHIHNNPLEERLASTNRRYKNVSVEVTDFKPILASSILTFS